MNLHITFSINGSLSMLDFPNATGEFIVTHNNFSIFRVTRESKVIAEFQAHAVVGWDSEPLKKESGEI